MSLAVGVLLYFHNNDNNYSNEHEEEERRRAQPKRTSAGRGPCICQDPHSRRRLDDFVEIFELRCFRRVVATSPITPNEPSTVQSTTPQTCFTSTLVFRIDPSLDRDEMLTPHRGDPRHPRWWYVEGTDTFAIDGRLTRIDLQSRSTSRPDRVRRICAKLRFKPADKSPVTVEGPRGYVEEDSTRRYAHRRPILTR